jgi:hypothetical protein
MMMEATGDYWNPFYFLLSESLNMQLVDAKAAPMTNSASIISTKRTPNAPMGHEIESERVIGSISQR